MSKWFSIEVFPGPVTNRIRRRPAGGELFEDVLHDRLAAHRQHFLRLRLGRGQKTGAQSGDGHDGDVDAH